MSDTITVTGIVATEPRCIVTSGGVPISSFRLASGQRRYDRASQAWVDADTNWYTVSTFRTLAGNVERSIKKGEHVVVTGRVRIRAWESNDRSGTSIDIEAESLGHDLLWCTSSATRSAPSATSTQPANSTQPAGSADTEPDSSRDEEPSSDEAESARSDDEYIPEFLPR
jgi:single-strand DNA-binding protein